jgi:hypothetical protein
VALGADVAAELGADDGLGSADTVAIGVAGVGATDTLTGGSVEAGALGGAAAPLHWIHVRAAIRR